MARCSCANPDDAGDEVTPSLWGNADLLSLRNIYLRLHQLWIDLRGYASGKIVYLKLMASLLFIAFVVGGRCKGVVVDVNIITTVIDM